MFQAKQKGHWSGNFKKKPAEDRTSPDGITHDSANEMKRWCRLLLMAAQGYISELQRQVKYELVLQNGNAVRTPKRISKKTGKPIGGNVMRYTIDFQYRANDGKMVYEEFKGFMAPQDAIKIAIFEAIYGIEVNIVKKP